MTKAIENTIAPTAIIGRRRPQRVLRRSDHRPSRGSNTNSQILGIRIPNPAAPGGMLKISVMKKSSKI